MNLTMRAILLSAILLIYAQHVRAAAIRIAPDNFFTPAGKPAPKPQPVKTSRIASKPTTTSKVVIIPITTRRTTVISTPKPATSSRPVAISPVPSTPPPHAFPTSLAAQKWSLDVNGWTGVAPMQMVVTEEQRVLFIDRSEQNPIDTPDGWPARAAEFDLQAFSDRPISLQTNSFCAGGSFIANGTLVSAGGDPTTVWNAQVGYQAIRLFTPCTDHTCEIQEWPGTVHMTSNRWYPATTRIQDGSLMIMGGLTDTTTGAQNPTLEFWPAKGLGTAIFSKFMSDTAGPSGSNLFPHLIALPNYPTKVLAVADQQAMIYDWATNTETRLPNLPNNQIVTYPMSGASALLPLKASNGFQPEVVFCGGTSLVPGNGFTASTPASNQCSRMVLTPNGISQGWATEQMPVPRVMGNFVILPDGRLFLVNGAQTGVAGYSSTIVPETNSYSEADNPVYQPYVYDPSARAGARFTNPGVMSSIARMYHSVASLLPDGRVLVAGSNPNPYFMPTGKYPTELRMEFYEPPYMSYARPTFTGAPQLMNFGAQYHLAVNIPSNLPVDSIIVSLNDLGFSTHGVQYSMRQVQLACSLSVDRRTLSFTAPPSGQVYPPGPAFLYISVAGLPSNGTRLMVG